MDKNNYHNFNTRGLIYFEKGNFKKSLENFKKSLQIKINYDAYKGLADVFYKKKEYNRTIKFYKNALNLNLSKRKKVKVEIYFGLAEVFFLKKEFEKAISYCKKALNSDLDQDERKKVKSFLGSLYFKNKNYKKAKKILSELYSEGKDYNELVKITLIKLYLHEQQFQKARNIIEIMLNSKETKNKAKYYLAFYYYCKNEINKAKNLIRKYSIDNDPEKLKEKLET